MGIAPTIAAASIGIPDTLFLMLLALVVFGPRRLPEIGRQIGKLMYEFRKVSNDFKYQMEEELRASEEADRQRKVQATIAAAVPVSQATLDVSPHPVAEASPLELGSGELAASPEAVPAANVRADAAPVPFLQAPSIQPPSSGEVVAAPRPFRPHGLQAVETVAESATESGAELSRTAEGPVVVADEGRTGAEVLPGVNEIQPGMPEDLPTGSEREASHV